LSDSFFPRVSTPHHTARLIPLLTTYNHSPTIPMPRAGQTAISCGWRTCLTSTKMVLSDASDPLATAESTRPLLWTPVRYFRLDRYVFDQSVTFSRLDRYSGRRTQKDCCWDHSYCFRTQNTGVAWSKANGRLALDDCFFQWFSYNHADPDHHIRRFPFARTALSTTLSVV
jgi:hypothetical protein